jgi:hypothetical protein
VVFRNARLVANVRGRRHQQGEARTPTPVFMVLEAILLLCGIVMTFKAYTGGEIEGR